MDLEIEVLDKKVQYTDICPEVTTPEEVSPMSSEFTWTDNKIDLIEVLESIILVKSINDGKVIKADFIKYMGSVLNVCLKNHTSLYNDILKRYDDPNIVNARITYLKKMIEALSKELTMLDENKRRRK